MAEWSVPGLVHLRQVCEDPVGRRVVARHHITRKRLGVTYLSHELLADPAFRTRFARDVAQLARVRDARVARIHRYVECHRGAAVIAEQVSGTSLRDLLLAHGAVGVEAALVVLSDSLRGLAAWHATGLAHGDIKPNDLILTPAGRVRLVDFGLWTPDTRRLLAWSTPFYLAPEQWSGRRATPAGDLYAATVTFFECLAGAPPFYADSSAELSTKHEQGTPPIDAIPGSVRELVCRGLAKDPHSRPDARSLLSEVVEAAARSVGAGWEQRGRRELASLVTNRSALPELPTLDRRSSGAGSGHRRPVRLAAVMGGALALAAGLASPPLAVLPGGAIFGSGARPPVLAFPEPAPGASVRAVTNGPLADRPVRTAPAAKATPAKRAPVARAPQPAQALPLAPPIPRADPHIAMGEYPHPPIPTERAARPRSGPASSCTPMRAAKYRSCPVPIPSRPAPRSTGVASGPVPVSVELPTPVEVSALLELPTAIEDRLPLEDLVSPEDSEFPEHLQPRSAQQGWEQAPQDGRHSAASPGKEGFPVEWEKLGKHSQ
jgi:tRNA A-37 threonylcarbamoyl transferase component Bud32